MLWLSETVERDEELDHMITLECPWCDGPMALATDAIEAACDGCSVRVELAPDPMPAKIALAA